VIEINRRAMLQFHASIPCFNPTTGAYVATIKNSLGKNIII